MKNLVKFLGITAFIAAIVFAGCAPEDMPFALNVDNGPEDVFIAIYEIPEEEYPYDLISKAINNCIYELDPDLVKSWIEEDPVAFGGWNYRTPFTIYSYPPEKDIATYPLGTGGALVAIVKNKSTETEPDKIGKFVEDNLPSIKNDSTARFAIVGFTNSNGRVDYAKMKTIAQL